MATNTLSGPSEAAKWMEKQVAALAGEAGDASKPRTVLLLPDASNGKGVQGRAQTYYYLPTAPYLKRDAKGQPMLSLTLLLSRKPKPTEDTVYPLITQGVLSLGLTLDVDGRIVASLKGSSKDDYKPLFAREVTFDLLREAEGKSVTLASTGALSGSAAGSLVANLIQEDTLALLASIRGEASSLSVSALVSYRVASGDRTITLRGSWAGIHDFLSIKSMETEADTFSRAELRGIFEEMASSGGISIQEIAQMPGEGQAKPRINMDAAFDMFMEVSPVILTLQTPELPTSEVTNRYTLNNRPHEMFKLDYQQTVSGSSIASKRITARLERVLEGALDGMDPDQFVHIVSPEDGNAGASVSSNAKGLNPVPRRVVIQGKKPAPRLPDDEGRRSTTSRMAVIANSMASIPRIMQAEDHGHGDTLSLLRSDLVEQVRGRQRPIDHWIKDDLDVPEPVPEPRSLPVVDDPDAPLWVDRVDRSKFWYAPRIALVPPTATDDPPTSPFLFTFERAGATVTAEPGLNGSVQFLLRVTIDNDTQAAIEARGRPQANPVAMQDLSVWLQLPFRDEAGATRMQVLPASVERNGDTLKATVALLNDWVRLCYGALSRPGFQSQPARLAIAYSYEAYVPLNREHMVLEFGRKSAITPVHYSAVEKKNRVAHSYFNAVKATYRRAGAEVRLMREGWPSDDTPVTPRQRPREEVEGGGGVGIDIDDAVVVRPTSGVVIAQPEIVQPEVVQPEVALQPVPGTTQPPPIIPPPLPRPLPDDIPVIRPPRHGIRTLAQQEVHDLLYPCDAFGALYREVVGGIANSVGCQDALQLGHTRYREYAEIRELAQPSLYRVYRSLQQPGRFLVVPATYRISRYGRSLEGKAYRPMILVYSVLDANNPSGDRVAYTIGLQPDLPIYARRDLMQRLRAFAQQPIVDYPTAIESEVEYAWAIGRGLRVEPLAIKTPEGFQVTFSTDISGALLLRAMLQTSGIFGNIRFKLPDGSSLDCGVALELGNITGPWSMGPIEVLMTPEAAHLLNSVGTRIRVSDLVPYSASGPGRPVAVETVIEPNSIHTVPLQGEFAEAHPVYSFPAGAAAQLEEIRGFVEDIHTNVIFVDLVNHDKHNISRLEMQVRIDGLDHTYSVAMSGDPPVGEIEVVLPLTTYLEKRNVRFQVTKILTTREVATTPWLLWDVKAHGNVISITWDLIEQNVPS